MSLNIIELDENGNKILKKVAGNSDIVDTAIETDSTWSGYKINSVLEDITDKSHLITYTEWGQLGITEVQSITSLKDLLDKMDSQSYARLSIGTSNASAFYDKGILPTTQPGILEVHKSSRINMIYSIDAGVKYSCGASSSSGDIKPWIQLPYITDNSTTSTVGTWSAKKISDSLVDIEDELGEKADKNAVLKSLEVVNGNRTAQIVPWSDGTHYRGFEDKGSNTYTDIITKDGVASIAKIENGAMTKLAELATMDKVQKGLAYTINSFTCPANSQRVLVQDVTTIGVNWSVGWSAFIMNRNGFVNFNLFGDGNTLYLRNNQSSEVTGKIVLYFNYT